MALDTVRKISFKPNKPEIIARPDGPRPARPATGGGTALCRASAQVTHVFGTHRLVSGLGSPVPPASELASGFVML